MLVSYGTLCFSGHFFFFFLASSTLFRSTLRKGFRDIVCVGGVRPRARNGLLLDSGAFLHFVAVDDFRF